MSDIPSWARVGAKVVCIADAVAIVGVDLGFPLFKAGDIYTIGGVEVDPDYGVFLWFKGHDSRHSGHIDGFRPLITRSQEQDMAIFRPILDQLVAA